MGVFHVFQIVQMVPNRAKNHYNISTFFCILDFDYSVIFKKQTKKPQKHSVLFLLKQN